MSALVRVAGARPHTPLARRVWAAAGDSPVSAAEIVDIAVQMGANPSLAAAEVGNAVRAHRLADPERAEGHGLELVTYANGSERIVRGAEVKRAAAAGSLYARLPELGPLLESDMLVYVIGAEERRGVTEARDEVLWAVCAHPASVDEVLDAVGDEDIDRRDALSAIESLVAEGNVLVLRDGRPVPGSATYRAAVDGEPYDFMGRVVLMCTEDEDVAIPEPSMSALLDFAAQGRLRAFAS